MERKGLSSNAKIILLCTILLIVFLSGSMIFMWSYLQELTHSPLTLGAKKMAEINEAKDVMCSCDIVDDFGARERGFYFNSSDIWTEPLLRFEP